MAIPTGEVFDVLLVSNFRLTFNAAFSGWLVSIIIVVSPTVFLTAGHCTAGLPSSRVWVTFDPQWTPASRLLPGTAYTDPQFGIDRTDSHDLAVVVLDAPVTGVTPLELPQANALAADPDTVVVVGYGADQPAAKKKNPTFTFDFTRRFGTATAKRVRVTDEALIVERASGARASRPASRPACTSAVASSKPDT